MKWIVIMNMVGGTPLVLDHMPLNSHAACLEAVKIMESKLANELTADEGRGVTWVCGARWLDAQRVMK